MTAVCHCSTSSQHEVEPDLPHRDPSMPTDTIFIQNGDGAHRVSCSENRRWVPHPPYWEGAGRKARSFSSGVALPRQHESWCENPFSHLLSRESLPANPRPLPNHRSSDMLTPCRPSNDTFSSA